VSGVQVPAPPPPIILSLFKEMGEHEKTRYNG
jgi:hypothetical protein